MVEPELDLGPRSRSVSRCESRSQSRRSSVMSVRSEDDLDCSWRVWRSSRRRLSTNVVLLWNIFWFKKFSTLLSSVRGGSPVWWASPERTMEWRVWGTCPGPSQGWAGSWARSVRPRWCGAGLFCPTTPAGQSTWLYTWRHSVLHSQDKARLKMLEDHVTKHSLRSEPHTMCAVCTRILEGRWTIERTEDNVFLSNKC